MPVETPDAVSAPSAPESVPTVKTPEFNPESAMDRAMVEAKGDPIRYRQIKRKIQNAQPTESVDSLGTSTPTAASSAAPTDADAAPSAATEEAQRAEKRAAENRAPQLESDIATLIDKRGKLRAEVEAEERRLSEMRTPPKTDARPASSATADDPEPDPTDAAKYPDGIFDRGYIRDAASHTARAEFRKQESARASKELAQAAFIKRVDEFDRDVQGFTQRVTEATKANPKALEGISPDIFDPTNRERGLKPSILVPEGQPITFGNVLADLILKSEHPVGMMRWLTDHPEHTRWASMPARDFYVAFGVAAAEVKAASQPPTLKTVSTSPPPPQTLGSKPAGGAPTLDDQLDEAIRTRDMARYKRIKAQMRKRDAEARGQ